MFAAPSDPSNGGCEEYWLTKQHQCQIDYIGELSEAQGMGELWNEYRLEFQQTIEAWKACVKSSILARFKYVVYSQKNLIYIKKRKDWLNSKSGERWS